MMPRLAAKVILLIWLLLGSPGGFAYGGFPESLGSLIGPRDSVMLVDSHGRVLYAKNENRPLVPASILKVFTSLVAIEDLGANYRFATDFFLDDEANLKIKGYGDPMLISEVLDLIARRVGERLQGVRHLNDLVLDGSYFQQPLTIPGVSSTSEPYDAPNGALNVNFNTVFFEDGGGHPVSAEPQTPLIPFAVERIKRSGVRSGRIVLSHVNQENTLYAGHLLRHFLERRGVRFGGRVRTGVVDPNRDRSLLVFHSPYRLLEVIENMLTYSNNFIANQLLVACGAAALGPPGSIEKGVSAARQYARSELKIATIQLVEGSGISRNNRISAARMQRVLARFESYRHLMRQENGEYYKTGTLAGISTRVGYIEAKKGRWCRYVVMCNTPGNTTAPLMRRIREHLAGL